MSAEHGEALRNASAVLRNVSIQHAMGGLSQNTTGLSAAHMNATAGEEDESESVGQAVTIFYCVLVSCRCGSGTACSTCVQRMQQHLVRKRGCSELQTASFLDFIHVSFSDGCTCLGGHDRESERAAVVEATA